tara:strand:- start:832 stop:1722 length:891 start_codon:yes stop_codon:yes gene_type:complete
MSLDTAPFLNKWVEQDVSYMTRDLLVYAQGIGCTELNYVYEHDDGFAAFPTFPITLGFKGTATDIVQFPSEFMRNGPRNPPFKGVVTGVDGERYIEMITPVPTEGAHLMMKSAILGCHKRGSGVSVESEAILFDKNTGVEYYKLRSGSFLVGAKDFTDSGITFSEKIKPPTRAPDHTEELKTSPYQAQLYRLSGDYNPLHVSPDFAQMVGFKEPILHGLCTLGFSARACIKAMCGNDPSLFKSIKLRFSKPVIPGDTLVVKMWNEGNGRVVFTTSVKGGAVVINNAVFEMHTGAKM